MNGGIPAPGRPRTGRDGGRQGRSARRQGRRWFSIAAGAVALAVLAALAAVHFLHRPGKWVVTAPPTAAGLGRDHNPADQLSFGSAVTKFKSSLTTLPAYRHLASTVSAVYALGSAQAVGFVGFNGTFSQQLTLRTTRDLAVRGVDPGPHGGTAGCGSAQLTTVCDWSTPTTVGIVLIAPTSGSGRSEPIAAADRLMIRLRNAVEHQAGGLDRGGSGHERRRARLAGHVAARGLPAEHPVRHVDGRPAGRGQRLGGPGGTPP
jgi:hypothetical protein